MKSSLTKTATLVVLVAALSLSGCNRNAITGPGDGGVQPGLPNPVSTNITWTAPDGSVNIHVTAMAPSPGSCAPMGSWAGIFMDISASGAERVVLCPRLSGSALFPWGTCDGFRGAIISGVQLGGTVKGNETISTLPVDVYLNNELNGGNGVPRGTFNIPMNVRLGSCS